MMNDYIPEFDPKNQITPFQLVVPSFHEKLMYYLVDDIFDKNEEIDFLKDNSKYQLNAKYRDFKIGTKDLLPGGFPMEKIVFNENKQFHAISIRAMHRIACQDLFTDSIHFMFNDYIKRQLLEYDSNHGNIIRFLMYNKQVPIKYLLTKDGGPAVECIHIDSVWNLDNEPGFLVYYADAESGLIKSFYMDGESIGADKFSITFVSGYSIHRK